MEFEDRAVAFIDVLGFKDLVNSAVGNGVERRKLSALISLLKSAVPTLDTSVSSTISKHLIPRHLYISDCIILSAPLSCKEKPNYNGVDIVIMRAIQLSHFLLNEGYLTRGGISAGKLWHTETNIVGPAYQEAYLLELNGNKPRIKIHDNALKYWSGGSRMCLKDGDVSFVNSLFDFYIPNNNEYGVIEATYEKYENFALNSISSKLPLSAIKKWKWFQCFLQSEKSEGFKWAIAQSPP